MTPAPSIGRIVHFAGVVEGRCEAAVVTGIGAGGTVDLAIFGIEAVRFARNVKQDEFKKSPGTWHWPERK